MKHSDKVQNTPDSLRVQFSATSCLKISNEFLGIRIRDFPSIDSTRKIGIPRRKSIATTMIQEGAGKGHASGGELLTEDSNMRNFRRKVERKGIVQPFAFRESWVISLWIIYASLGDTEA